MSVLPLLSCMSEKRASIELLCSCPSQRYVCQLTALTHPHIYGIDIPSELEFVPHGRNIAQHIGAHKIIFKNLDDLESACVEPASPGTEVRGNLNFEIGVFSRAYLTPIPAGYFDLLQTARGETEMKAVLASENFATLDVECSTSTRYSNEQGFP